MFSSTSRRPAYDNAGAKITEIAVLGRNNVHFAWNREQDTSSVNPLSFVLPPLLDHLRAGIVVGHNLSFDLKFISYEANRIDCDGPDLQLIDTLGLARRFLEVEDYRLETLLGHFDIVPEGDLHTAVVDAQATRLLFWELVDVGAIETLADAGMRRLNWSTF